MKKVLTTIMLFVIISSFVVFNVTANGISEVVTMYYELDTNNEYLEDSKEFKFDNSMLTNDQIYDCFAQINLSENYRLELIYNIFGESQYLLIESTSNDYQAYIIYDFLLEEALEYSCSRLSDWSMNSKARESVKFYLNLTSKFYLKENKLFDINDILISEFDETNIINDKLIYGDDEIPLTDLQMDLYNNRIIRDEYDIKNAFFFKNYWIDLEYNFGSEGSCAIVAAVLLLSYYDTFYNDSIISDYETYNDVTYLTKNKVAKKLVDKNSDGIYDNFYIDLWDSESFELFYPYEYDPSRLPDFAPPAGPSEKFHDYLLEIAKDKEYFNDGMSISNTEKFIADYLDMKNISNITTEKDLFRVNIIDILESDTPVIIGMAGYKYYFKQFDGTNETLVGFKDEIDYQHAVVAYGYQNTSLGLFFHVNMGWPINCNSSRIEYYNDTYVNADLMGYYTYIDASNLEHVCNYAYLLYNESNNLYIEICPCENFDDNFSFISSNLNCDFVNYYGHEDPIPINHQLDLFEEYNEYYHLKKCRLYEYCEMAELESHNFTMLDTVNNSVHRYKCKDCGYVKYEQHNDDGIIRSSNVAHYKYCNICGNSYNKEEHNFIFSGNDESHTGICRDCNYETSEDGHLVELNTYTEQFHQYLCNCGYERFEQHSFNEDLICMICNFEHLNHSYSYSKYSSSNHLKYCLCGEEIYESHSFIIGLLGNTCRHCGYHTEGSVTIDSTIGDVKYNCNEFLYLENQTNLNREENNEE